MSEGPENKGNSAQASPPGHGENPGQGSGGKPTEPKYKIRIDREEFTVHQEVLTGAELRRLPNPAVGADRDLFEVVPGGSDKKIEATDGVQMRHGLRFFTAPAQINPGRS